MKTEHLVDVLAVGAHPDDVELGCGGLLHKLAQAGRRVAILDLTRGEMSTRGTVEERGVEAGRAAAILGVAERANAGLPDGGVANTPEQRLAVVAFIRQFRPKLLLTLMTPDRHPDHAATHALVTDANYLSGLARIDTGRFPHRTQHILYFHPYTDFAGAPAFVADISANFEAKLASLRAHASQFHNPGSQEPETFISSKAFWDGIEVRARYWGARIGATYGEPLHADGPVPLDCLPGLGV
jgi:bacillithiol biosynthesis deacetylase BshB1